MIDKEYKKTIDIKFNLKDAAMLAVKNLSKDIAFGLKDSDIGKTLAESFSSTLENGGFLKNLIEKGLNNFSEIVKDSIEELNNILDFSELSNSKTRNLAFQYGFNSAQAYGYNKAMDLLGFESEEDLYYANAEEIKLFRNSFDKYSDYYNELYDSGFFDTLREYQYEMQDFKQEMQMEVITFFMNNKDIIKSGLIALMKMSEWVAKIFGKLVSWFGSTNTSPATVSDVINQYRNVNSTNTNVNISNQFNNTPKEDETWLANAGELTYEQIVRALGGEA